MPLQKQILIELLPIIIAEGKWKTERFKIS